MFLFISWIANAFQTYNIYLLTTCFLDQRRVQKKWEAAAFCVLFLQLTVPYLLIHIAGVTFFCSLTGCLWITLLYRGTWKKRILSGLFVCITMILAESIVAVLAGYVNFAFLGTTEYESIFGTVCAPIVEYMVVKFVRNFKHLRKGEFVPVTYWVISIALPICSLALYLLLYRQTSWSRWELLGCILFLFLINVFVFFLYDRQIANFHIMREKEILEQQNQYQSNQLKLMCEMEEQLQRQRHDFMKHMSMLFYLNEEKESGKIKNYIQEIKEQALLEYKYVETGNAVIDSIINYKIREAEDAGIQIETDIVIPSDLELSAYDMNVLLTNLLDNALEASKKEEKGEIRLTIRYIHHKLNIHIRNLCSRDAGTKHPDLTSTKRDGRKHGYGLKIIQETVDKYEGIMEISVKENWFDVKIGLFINSNRPNRPQ